MEKFTKDMLKTGMWVTLEGEEMAMVLLGTKDGDIFCGQTWGSLSDYKNDLTRGDTLKGKIIRIYQPYANYGYCSDLFNKNNAKLIWQRTEQKEMTVAEIEKALGYSVKIIKGGAER